jgi:hypothetical protein
MDNTTAFVGKSGAEYTVGEDRLCNRKDTVLFSQRPPYSATVYVWIEPKDIPQIIAALSQHSEIVSKKTDGK